MAQDWENGKENNEPSGCIQQKLQNVSTSLQFISLSATAQSVQDVRKHSIPQHATFKNDSSCP